MEHGNTTRWAYGREYTCRFLIYLIGADFRLALLRSLAP